MNITLYRRVSDPASAEIEKNTARASRVIGARERYNKSGNQPQKGGE